MSNKKSIQRWLYGATTFALSGAMLAGSFGGVASSAFAASDQGGSAGNVGYVSGAGPKGSGWDWFFTSYDTPNRDGNAFKKFQEWNGWAKAADGSRNIAYEGRGSKSYVYSPLTMLDGPGEAVPKLGEGVCSKAFKDAIAAHGGTKDDYRIVLVGAFIGDTLSTTRSGKYLYQGSPGAGKLYEKFVQSWPELSKRLNADATDPVAYHNYVRDLAVQAMGGLNADTTPTRQICVVLNKDEPASGYNLNVSTDAQGKFTLSGTKSAVHDAVHIESTSKDAANVNVKTILHWDGVEGAEPKSVMKEKSMSTKATTDSPSFSPADFGWEVWPAGTFWYDVQIPKQAGMKAAIDTPDRDSRELWKSMFNLEVTTDKGATFAMAGDSNPVNDQIHTRSNGSQFKGVVNADVVLNWDGVGNVKPKAATKQVKLNVDGTTTSPDFTPADFGWKAWPAGNFWFDVKVPKQALMSAAVDTPDRDARESWNVTPRPPVKELTSGDPKDVLDDNEVLASGMFYNAEITANASGYDNMAMTDVINTDKVFIGATDKDVSDAVYVLDPNGNKVKSVDVNIERAEGKVTVTAQVNGIPAELSTGEYKLVVPTYVLPTGKDYTIPDDSKVCFNGDPCLNGDSKVTRKVTPKPDKVWTLDKDGSLVAADPERTNQVAADQKVFLMNDEVAAVVNGRIAKGLAENLDSYEIVDDWSDAAKYVNFDDAKGVTVWYENAPGSGKYDNITSQFDVSVENHVTKATAKADFLKATKGLSGDRKVKLNLSGKFRDNYDTDGKIVKMINKGHEKWNNETQKTNEPPVFTWTPNPNKKVIGSAEEDGEHTYANINGMKVFGGQKVEYSIGIDLRVPNSAHGAATARGVKTLAIEDAYDANFTPDTRSVEIWDSRDPSNPAPIPASAYKLAFDKDAHKFRVDFTPEWIAKNVNNPDGSANSDWLTQGWLSVRFTGTVNKDLPGGTVVRNQAFQIINDAKTATEIPEVTIPSVKPDKEDLNTDLIDIDGKTVVEGDIIVYRLTLDASVDKDDLAYYVHKLGMIDDFDEEYLDVDADSVRVTDKETGTDVTDKFMAQVKDGKLAVAAKQVDSKGYDGVTVEGEPQPEDLFTYMDAGIKKGETPIIDQSLLGKKYYITFQSKVKKETDGYVIKNQATQNIENNWMKTKIVSNPLKDIDPDKDVVVSEEKKDNSINEAEVKLNDSFNYRLNSSSIPANRAYKASQWSITDTFDKAHDQYTGIWAIYANEDIYDGQTLVYKKGDLIQDSAAHETEPRDGLFNVTFDEKSYTIKAESTQKFLDLVNTRQDMSQSFSLYTKMIRIAPSERVENKAIESYNNHDRETNVVWTKTFEHPAIDIEKYTLKEGMEKGDRDDVRIAYEIGKLADEQPASTVEATAEGTPEASVEGTPEVKASPEAATVETPEAGTPEAPAATAEGNVEVGITLKNTGDVPLKDVAVEDTTHDGMFGMVEDITCKAPEGTDAAKLVETKREGAWVKVADINTLAVGQSVDCVGMLTGMEKGMTHGDTVKVTAKSIYTGKEVKDDDPWFAKWSSNPALDVEKYTFSEGLEKGDRDHYEDAFVLDNKQAKDGLMIGFDVTNTGDESLVNLKFADTTFEATTGKVEDLKWITEVTADEKAKIIEAAKAAKAELGTPEATPEASAEGTVEADVPVKVTPEATVEGTIEGTVEGTPETTPEGTPETSTENNVGAKTVITDPVFMTIGDKEYLVRDASMLQALAVGQTEHLIGTLKGVEPGTPHADTFVATGEGIWSKTQVGDNDPWFAKLASPEVPEPKCPVCNNPPTPEQPGTPESPDKGPDKGAVTGEAYSEGSPLLSFLGGLLLALAIGGGGAYAYNRKKSASAAATAKEDAEPRVE